MTTESESPMSQGTIQPEETPEVTLSAPDGGSSQAPDLSTIRVRVGDGPDAEMSVDDLKKSYLEVRPEMKRAQDELAKERIAKVEALRRYEWADTFAKDLQANPGLRQHLESFYAGQTEDNGYRQTQMQGPTRESIELADLKVKVASFTLNNSLDELGRELKDEFGVSLTPEQRAFIWEDVARTNSEDVKGLYWARFGKDIVQMTRKETTKQVANKIAENTGAYQAPSAVSPGAIPSDAPAMFSDAWNAAVLRDLEKASK
jgi:hypothetical protein